MNSIVRPPVKPGPNGRSPGDLDGLLRRFFRAALPNPWPAPPVPAPTVPGARLPLWKRFRPGRRLSLAAALAFLLIGYLWLASLFPRTFPAVERLPGEGGVIGQRPERVHLPNGRNLLIQQRTIPGPRPQIQIDVIEDTPRVPTR
jgi:hypothetical protein